MNENNFVHHIHDTENLLQWKLYETHLLLRNSICIPACPLHVSQDDLIMDALCYQSLF